MRPETGTIIGTPRKGPAKAWIDGEDLHGEFALHIGRDGLRRMDEIVACLQWLHGQCWERFETGLWNPDWGSARGLPSQRTWLRDMRRKNAGNLKDMSREPQDRLLSRFDVGLRRMRKGKCGKPVAPVCPRSEWPVIVRYDFGRPKGFMFHREQGILCWKPAGYPKMVIPWAPPRTVPAGLRAWLEQDADNSWSLFVTDQPWPI